VRHRVILFALICVLSAFVGVAYSADDKEKAATDAATQWLTLTDSGQYAESWFQASSTFRGVVSKEQWKNALDAVRTPLGKVESRHLKSATYTTTIPNAPSGEYVILQFETSFENAPPMIETVTPILEKDGKWKVSGYFIKRPGQ
jgi:Protein of unknown function (DUF4019)